MVEKIYFGKTEKRVQDKNENKLHKQLFNGHFKISAE